MITRIHHVVAPLIFVLGVGFTFTPSGCASSIPPAAPIPNDGDLARELRRCAAEHEGHLGSTSQAISFDVHLDENGDVDSVALREATLGDEQLETCMVHALRALTIDDLPMRLSGSGRQGAVAPGSRGLLGQPETFALEACLAEPPCALALGLFIGASFLAVTVYVYVNNASLVHSQAKTLAATASRSRKKACIEMFADCDSRGGSCTSISDWGLSWCALCLNECPQKGYTFNKCYECGFR